MQASVKAGSVLKIQLSTTESVFASDPSILGIAIAAGVLTLTALKQGSCKIVYENTNGLRVEGTVNVTA